MGQTPSKLRREGRMTFYPGGKPNEHNPYAVSSAWGADIKARHWQDGWDEAEAAYTPPEPDVCSTCGK